MESDAIEKILESVAAGKTTPAEALLSLKKEPFTDLGYAKVDHHRALRQNAAEVIYGEGKTPSDSRHCGISAAGRRKDGACYSHEARSGKPYDQPLRR